MKNVSSLKGGPRLGDVRYTLIHIRYIVKDMIRNSSLFSGILGRRRGRGSGDEAMIDEVRLTGDSYESYVRAIATELHYRTPKGLKYLKESCPQCVDLPEDCRFRDYTIFNVRKAEKKLKVHHRYIQRGVIDELEKINPELADHLRERLICSG